MPYPVLINFTGFELGGIPSATNTFSPDGCGTTAYTMDTSIKRSGLSSICLTGELQFRHSLSSVYGCNVSLWFYKTGNPSADFRLVGHNIVHLDTGVFLKTDGTIQACRSGVGYVGNAASVEDNTWHNLFIRFAGSDSTMALDAHLDRVPFCLGQLVDSIGIMSHSVHISGVSDCPIWFDDLAVLNTDPVPAPNIAVFLAAPSADVQDGTWTIASGGNTNIYDAINNPPIVGTSPSAASDSNRIESVDSSGDNATDELRVDMPAYSSLSASGHKTVWGIVPWVLAGEEAGTGTKSISFGAYANPAAAYTAVADVTGGVSGAVDTYPTQWFWYKGALITRPAVSLDSALTLGLRKTDTGTRSATVGFLGAYVCFIEAAPPGFRAPAELMIPLLAM